MSHPRLKHAADADRPRLFVVDTHPQDCDCERCEPYVPSVPPRLTARAIAGRALAGFAAGHAAAFAILGPTTAWHVLVAALLWRPL